MIPGSVASFVGSQLDSISHPLPDEEVEAIFAGNAERLINRIQSARSVS